MLERIYVDNFRCFVNFEWKPTRLALLLGENGSGKTSILEVLERIRSLISNDAEIRRGFPSSSRTRWDTRLEQRVELDVRLGSELFSYGLTVKHSEEDPSKSEIAQESLFCDGAPLLEFVHGQLMLRTETSLISSTVKISTRTNRSALGAVGGGAATRKLTAFKKWLDEEVWYFRPNPRSMSGRTDEQNESLDVDLLNFASWYPSLIAQDLDAAIQTQSTLREILLGFDSLSVDKSRPQLQVRFSAGKGVPYAVDFGELSDGQRALIALHVLRHAVLKPGRLVIFDEPDNYVALKEIQPWLLEVSELALDKRGPQVWFVSHHPEVLNQLAPSHGVRFFRQESGPVRSERFKGINELTAADVVARGLESIASE
ncbi:AAA family ATPase [Corallococcus sp. BB11-1]|uniref:AAA family ATPase n=1 Tax=Corallococcus sp. BB11-1 TaxID=2996783 RepID=UPI002270A49D|nr:ATP-binding protein [Corallococcus sp. BB11-1]MCY1031317.1 AAA family ATPase [Corallococcus sp. BB11-1]